MNPTHPSFRFQAHLAFPQGLPSVQKCQKSLQARPTQTQGQKDSAAKIKDKLTNDKNGQLVTKAICNKGFRGNSSVLPRIKIRVGGQVSSPQSLPAHSLNRCVQFINERSLTG
jgi:hypothetical protein